MTKNVAKVENNAVVLADQLAEMGGAGFENVTSRDVLLPRLTILQGLSPQLNKGRPEYIAGASVGQICDVANGDVWDEIQVVLCHYSRVFLEWAPRASGKGLVMNHGDNVAILEQTVPDEKRRPILPNGNIISESAQWAVLNLTAGGRRSMIPMASTALKSSRQLMTRLTNMTAVASSGKQFRPPIFYKVWTLSTVSVSNSSGDWSAWKTTPGQTVLEADPTGKLLQEARDFYEQCEGGLARKQSQMAHVAEEEEPF